MNTEAWVSGYPVDFANLQKNYPSTAPKDLASLGYEGLTSLYFSSDQHLGRQLSHVVPGVRFGPHISVSRFVLNELNKRTKELCAAVCLAFLWFFS